MVATDFLTNVLADVTANIVSGVGDRIDKVRVRFEPTKYHQSFADTFTYTGQYRQTDPVWRYEIDSTIPKVLRDIQIYFQDDIDATNYPRVEVTVDGGVVFQTVGKTTRSPFTKTRGVSIDFRNGKSIKNRSAIDVRVWNAGTGHASAKAAAIFWTLGDV